MANNDRLRIDFYVKSCRSGRSSLKSVIEKNLEAIVVFVNDPERRSSLKMVWQLCGTPEFEPPLFFTYGSESASKGGFENAHPSSLIIRQEN